MKDEKQSMFRKNVDIKQNKRSEPVGRVSYEASYTAGKNTSGKNNKKRAKSSNTHASNGKKAVKRNGVRKDMGRAAGRNTSPRNPYAEKPYAGYSHPKAGVSREEERRAHRDERRRQQRIRRKIFYAVLIFIVIIIGIVLSLTVFFNIATIDVKGESIYSADEITAASGIKIGDNLFLLKKSNAEANICEKLPFIGSVDIKISVPSRVVLTVKQTSIKCAVESDSGYIMLDETGKVLCKVSTLEEVYEGAGVTPPEGLAKPKNDGDSAESESGKEAVTDATPNAPAAGSEK